MMDTSHTKETDELGLALSHSELGLGLVESVRMHLTYNHYPSVSEIMIPVCIKAIDSYNAHLNGDELIELPAGILWRGNSTAPAYAIIESHHLDSWINNEG